MEYLGLVNCMFNGWTVDKTSISEDYQKMLKWKNDIDNETEYSRTIVPISGSDVLYTENDIRDVYDGGFVNGDGLSIYSFSLVDFIKSRKELIVVEEKTIPITLGQIKATCGWSRYVEVTGANPYMLNEWDPSDREIFDVKISHAEKLNLI